uniref:BTB domain-containing protein n=1 Tax=Periophthalmus magnuspinnatus TaxID=409849 RepID=A0A3B4AJV2_9GOBI
MFLLCPPVSPTLSPPLTPDSSSPPLSPLLSSSLLLCLLLSLPLTCCVFSLHRSLQIIGLGSECASGASTDELMSQGQLQGALLWSYLGPGAVGAPESTLHPPFMEYTARVFDDVNVLVRDCPDWELLESEWSSVRKAVEKADILVLKYSVSDKQTFQWLRGVFGPRLRPLVRHCGVPVVLVAVGARLNDEGPPCTCPLCASDWRLCVPHSEGLALSRELGATYLELPSLNHVFVGRYFGSVLEYFMIQCLKHKAKDRHEKRRGNKLHELRPPHLEQPGESLRKVLLFNKFHFLTCSTAVTLQPSESNIFMYPLCVCESYPRPPPVSAERPQTSALFSCLSGAWEWEHLQEALEEKLKNPLAVAQLLERIRSLLGLDWVILCTTAPLLNCSFSCVAPPAGSVLPAHRAVLVARCDVMAAMFSGKYAEARSRVVPIHGVSSDTFLSFLEYLYTDSCCPASVLQAMAVLVCAEMYQVKRLQHLCEVCVCAYLQSMPSRELASTGISVVRLLRRAKCHNAEQLYVWLLHFIANNYLIFSHKPDFLELSEEERDTVERLRWPSRGYLQELSEYQQKRRKLRKSRCAVM